MTRAEVLQKIRLLLTLGGNNPNPHEAAAAIAKARELMRIHNLTDSDVEVERSSAFRMSRKWMRVIAASVAGVNGCVTLSRTGRRHSVVFAGRPLAVAVSIEMFAYLRRAISRSLPRGRNDELYAVAVLLAQRLAPWCDNEEADRVQRLLAVSALTHRKRRVTVTPEIRAAADSINVSRQACGEKGPQALAQ